MDVQQVARMNDTKQKQEQEQSSDARVLYRGTRETKNRTLVDEIG